MWTYVHRKFFFTIFGQCINVLNYNNNYPETFPTAESFQGGHVNIHCLHEKKLHLVTTGKWLVCVIYTKFSETNSR